MISEQEKQAIGNRAQEALNRAEAATPGPWMCNVLRKGRKYASTYNVGNDDGLAQIAMFWHGERAKADGEFIAAARELVPALAADCRRLLAELREVQASAERFCKSAGDRQMELGKIDGERLKLRADLAAARQDAARNAEAWAEKVNALTAERDLQAEYIAAANAKITALTAENERLREALGVLAHHENLHTAEFARRALGQEG